jgi:hypothetical protein
MFNQLIFLIPPHLKIIPASTTVGCDLLDKHIKECSNLITYLLMGRNQFLEGHEQIVVLEADRYILRD